MAETSKRQTVAGLTLAGHAHWLKARIADTVAERSASRLGRVLRVGAWKARGKAARGSLWFICARWTC